MPGAKNVIRIDGEKLRRELEMRNVTMQEASVRIGFGGNYISNAIARGAVSKSAMKLIELALHVSPADIAPEEPKEEPKSSHDDPEQTEIRMSTEELAIDDIREAIAQGVREGLEAYFGKIRIPVNKLAKNWKDALHGMEAEQ